jgi:hypothetical protein
MTRTMRRILVVALLVATPLLGAAACSTYPPPASDQAATNLYNVGEFLASVLIAIWCGGITLPNCRVSLGDF